MLNLPSISEYILATFSVLFCGGNVVNRSEQASCLALTRVDLSGPDIFPQDFHGPANLILDKHAIPNNEKQF